MPGESHELTAEARIRRAALKLFAQHGFDATSLRAIARAARTSPSLIIHHFGSKEGLRDAVNADVIATINRAVRAYLPPNEPHERPYEAPEAAFREVFGDRPELGAYTRRMFFDGDETAVAVLRQFMVISRRVSAAFEQRGWMRQVADQEMRDLQLIILDLGPVLFAPLLAAYFEQPPLSPELHHRWAASQFDMLTDGIFTDDAPRFDGAERKAR